MAMEFHFAQKYYFVAGLVLLFLGVAYRIFWHRPTMYTYSLTQYIADKNLQASSICTQFFFWVRTIALLLMVILIGKPQLVDSKSKITVNGIDIVIALDMSASMKCFDDIHDRRSRLEVAKKEAINFISKRTNDNMGLVLFGRYSLVRCPLTIDKDILKSIVQDLDFGQPSEDMQYDTMLAKGLVTALQRLQNSKARSKVVVLLTDGLPSAQDLPVQEAISIAQKLSIKVYTIGIGSEQGSFIQDPIFGLQRVQTPINIAFLEQIAKSTGGTCFQASNPKDLAQIYYKIDQLEKTEIETDVYHNYHDFFMPILLIVLGLLLSELVVGTLIWFIL